MGVSKPLSAIELFKLLFSHKFVLSCSSWLMSNSKPACKVTRNGVHFGYRPLNHHQCSLKLPSCTVSHKFVFCWSSWLMINKKPTCKVTMYMVYTLASRRFAIHWVCSSIPYQVTVLLTKDAITIIVECIKGVWRWKELPILETHWESCESEKKPSLPSLHIYLYVMLW